jgi:hypothetical protein
MRTPTGTAIRELRSGLRGGLHEPGDPEYTDMCTHFGRHDRTPVTARRAAVGTRTL